ncbi:MAG: peroxiredoxin [Candidatus Pacebacteria bacterium]|nr:peroxiredoxin [Candidatus Paceibacterota bacterium]
MLKEGEKIIDFALLDQDSIEHKLSDNSSGRVLLYFYPKDDTPGCTKEACTITALYDDFKKAGITVLGVSSDSRESHKKFKEKYNIPFILLSDPDKKVIKEYGASSLFSTKRISYLIENGLIKKVYQKVDPANHAMQILDEINK